MAVYKNVASQKIAVFAFDSTDGSPKTGDAANITAQISKDGAATAATNDTNPTELDATDAPGVYIFDMTQAETNADLIILAAVSSTSNIELEPVICYTTPGDSTAIAADAIEISGSSAAADNVEANIGNLDAAISTTDTVCDGIKAVTDNLPNSGALTDLATAAALTTVDGNVDAILVDTGTTLPGTLTTIEGKIDTVDTNVDAVLVDTSTTLDGKINTIDTVVDAILVDTAEIGAAGAGLTEAGGTGDHLTAIPEVDANVTKISGDSTAADNLESAMKAVAVITASGSHTTTTVQSADSSPDDSYNGRTLYCVSGTAANVGHGMEITDFANTNGEFTTPAWPSAASNGDVFHVL